MWRKAYEAGEVHAAAILSDVVLSVVDSTAERQQHARQRGGRFVIHLSKSDNAQTSIYITFRLDG